MLLGEIEEDEQRAAECGLSRLETPTLLRQGDIATRVGGMATVQVPRYRKPRGSERLMRVLGLWRLHDNTLLPWVNARYRRAHWRARMALQDVVAPATVSPLALQHLRDEGLCQLPGAFNRDKALAFSHRLGAIIEGKSGSVHQHHRGAFALRNPLDALGEDCLDLFDGPTGALLQAHFGSYFRIEWVDCYRTYADAARRTSWLWHIDNVPAGCHKVMLLLTDSTRDTGAMRYLTRSASRALRHAGYFGTRAPDRELDLSRYAKRAGITIEPRYVEAPAGSTLVFDPNILHCGEPPREDWRDVMTFFVLPSLRPWREAYHARGGRERVHGAPGGYPPAPEM